MNGFLLYSLLGAGASLILTPIGIFVYKLFRDTIERRKVKRMIENRQFLSPLDQKDYNNEKWLPYINSEENVRSLERISGKTFTIKEIL